MTRQYELDERLYKVDLEILDRYQGFSKHVAQVATAGILASWAIGVALKHQVTGGVAVGMGAAAVLFALSVGVSLYHQYESTDAMASYVGMVRSQDPVVKAKEKRAMTESLRASGFLVALEAVLLALGGLALAAAFVAFLANPPTPSTTPAQATAQESKTEPRPRAAPRARATKRGEPGSAGGAVRE